MLCRAPCCPEFQQDVLAKVQCWTGADSSPAGSFIPGSIRPSGSCSPVQECVTSLDLTGSGAKNFSLSLADSLTSHFHCASWSSWCWESSVSDLAPQRSGLDLHGLVVKVCPVKVLGLLPHTGSPAAAEPCMPEFSPLCTESPKLGVLDQGLQIQSKMPWTPFPDDRAVLFPVGRSCRSSCNSVSSLEKAH